MMTITASAFVSAVVLLFVAAAADALLVVNGSIDASRVAPFRRGFQQGFGSCHAVTSLRADWQRQLQQT